MKWTTGWWTGEKETLLRWRLSGPQEFQGEDRERAEAAFSTSIGRVRPPWEQKYRNNEVPVINPRQCTAD